MGIFALFSSATILLLHDKSKKRHMEIGVLFDLDGVLIDSESRYTEFWNEVEKTYPTGIPDFAIQIKGNTLPKILDTYFPQPERQTYIHRMLKDFEATMRYDTFHEAMRFVDELNAASIKCAIVTSSSAKKMETLYAQNPGFREKFQGIVTGDVVSHSKPHPEPYLRGADSLGIDIRHCCIFEDSLSGIESGQRAGACVVGIATTLPFGQINGKACKTIHDFTGFHVEDMLSIMGNFNKL